MIPLNFHHLYYFFTIAKTGSVSLAAKELRLAQPTLSAQLKQFEFFLDKKLFDRKGRRLELTEDGKEILNYAAMIFDLGKELMDRQGDQLERGRIRLQIGVDNFVPKTAIDLLLRYIYRVSPNAFVTLSKNHLEQLIPALNDHQLDMILCDQLPLQHIDERIESHLIAKIPIYFCAHPKFKHLTKHFPCSMHGAPVILPTTSSALSESIQHFFLEHKIKPKIVAEIQDLEVVRRLALDGLGIAPMNLLTIKKAPTSLKLVIFNQNKPTPFEEKIYLLKKTRKYPHPLVEKVSAQFRLKDLLTFK